VRLLITLVTSGSDGFSFGHELHSPDKSASLSEN
jgi:hypothetical protein